MNDQSKENSSSQFLKTDAGKTKSNSIEVPSISLPKGGGAIKGIDEKFSVNAVNGTASFSVPLPFSPARGASPALSLSYNSGAGNSSFGLGWNISLASIKRKTDKGLPQYLDAIDSDIFLFSEAEDLVPEFKKGGDGSFLKDAKGDYIINEKTSGDGLNSIRFYKPRIEGLFARIERWQEKATGLIKWRIITRDNTTTLFGWSNNSIVANPDDNKKIFEWLPEFVFDDKGNCCHYIYKADDEAGFDYSLTHHKNRFVEGKLTYTNIYPDRILYGNKTPYKKFSDPFPTAANYLFETVFDYGSLNETDSVDTVNTWDFRTDAFSDYKAGFEIRTTRLCRRVLLFHHFTGTDEYDGLVRSINFEYDTSSQRDFTFLKSITSSGHIKKPDSSYSSKKMPAVEFEYQKHEWNTNIKTIDTGELIHAPAGLDGNGYQFTDLFNEGLQGIFTEQANGWYYKHNLGDGKFEPAKLISPKPSFAGVGGQLQLADLNGDGSKQLVSFATEPKGYFELDDNNEWQPFKSFQSVPNITISDAYIRILDLNGDGKTDILISEDNVFSWYPSSGKNGYLPVHKTIKTFDEEVGPNIVFADLKQTIFLADMSGSGMTDIVRIRNGEVCYWPNLGYGKFGAKVAMDNAPVFDHTDNFNPAYIRLADIDGSGTTDIIYLGKNKFTCWMNLSGNSFAGEPFETGVFPSVDNSSTVTVTDLLGNGVACIVWSSTLQKDAAAPVKYIDLMSSKKPHIMVSYKNNLGKEVYFEYKVSTKFYIEDKLAGRPWVTKLHFPVHCVSNTEMVDKISGYRFVSSYKYHHGYFDHAEREFRGFGMVEQTDSEHFEHWIKTDASNISDATLHQEPVVSKTWFHTGAFINREKILTQFANEYWYEETKRQSFDVTHHELPLPDARLIASPGIAGNLIETLSADEWREAIRACKSMALRSEIFAHDAPLTGATDEQLKKQLTPYSVSTHNCIIELIQPKGNNKFAVFTVKECEAITYNYERRPEDPRIAHSLNIKLDEFGNVLESAAVVYPRLTTDALLPEAVQQEQGKTIISFTQNQFTNDVLNDEVYRLRLPSATKTFELKDVAKIGVFYSLKDFENILTAANEVAYHHVNAEPTGGIPQKRLIEQVHTNYRSNDLVYALPLHQLESLAMPFESFQLAFTPELLSDIYGEKVDEGFLNESKFIHSEGDDKGWIRSGNTELIKTDETAADAQNRFYVPLSYTDPFGSTTKVKYYGSYFIFINETTDALENKATVDRFNFRTLSPQRMKDANDNITEAITDELGLVKAMAVFGKGNEADDLLGLTEFTEGEEKDFIREFFNVPESPEGVADSAVLHENAKKLLNHATTRFVYDFDVYLRTGKPAVLCSIVREEHFQTNNNAAVQLGFEYSNGLGQVIMKKVQTEPGEAKKAIINEIENMVTIAIVNTGTQIRWLGNGRAILNNKGNSVKQYEPYFSVTPHYEDVKELVETGVTPIMYYDAPGRLVKTLMPDDTFSKVDFDSWKQLSYDANDTVMESKWYFDRMNNLFGEKEKTAAQQAAMHFNTPAIVHLDTLGRPFLSIEHNKRKAFTSDNIIEEFYSTLAVLDAENNLRSVIDARGNTVMQYKYDMLGNQLYSLSMDAGERWMLNDCMGKPVYAWDARQQLFKTEYDPLHRPVKTWLYKPGIELPFLVGVAEFIDAENAEAGKENNLRGKIYKQYDQSGCITNMDYDFKGNLLKGDRSLVKEIKTGDNYQTEINWNVTDATSLLEEESFMQITTYDALNRMKELHSWHNATIPASIYIPEYNERGVLKAEQLYVRGKIKEGDAANYFIKNISYNAKGQKENIIYGNNTVTTYRYDEFTFRLIQLKTTRRIELSPGSYKIDTLQDLNYTYDPVGNILSIKDDAQQDIFFRNNLVEASSTYLYDALYRLIQATGREHEGQLNPQPDAYDSPRTNLPHPNDGAGMGTYTERYEYDSVGNILMMRHHSSREGQSWTRQYQYDSASNRLLATGDENSETGFYASAPGLPERYTYNIHGSMTAMPHLQQMDWDLTEHLQHIQNATLQAWYRYDAQKQRTRKIVEHDGIKEERIYLGGLEIYRKWRNDELEEENETIQLVDGSQRMILIEHISKSSNPQIDSLLYRYQYSNHLGSASIELDEKNNIISYEEYHPYGTTAYQAVDKAINKNAKRYRYTGMERDEESGLNYHTARYYVGWLGRWCSADPIGIQGGMNLFLYGNANPNNSFDHSGCQSCSLTHNAVDPETGNVGDLTICFDSEGNTSRQFSPYTQINETRFDRVVPSRHSRQPQEANLSDAEVEILSRRILSEADEALGLTHSQLDMRRIGLAGVEGLFGGAAVGLGVIALGIVAPVVVPFVVAGLLVAGALSFMYMIVQATTGDQQGATENFAGMLGSTVGGYGVNLGAGGQIPLKGSIAELRNSLSSYGNFSEMMQMEAALTPRVEAAGINWGMEILQPGEQLYSVNLEGGESVQWGGPKANTAGEYFLNNQLDPQWYVDAVIRQGQSPRLLVENQIRVTRPTRVWTSTVAPQAGLGLLARPGGMQVFRPHLLGGIGEVLTLRPIGIVNP